MEYAAQLDNLNPLAIAASAVVMMVVATVWYSPLMFAKSWARLSGIRRVDIRPERVRLGFFVGCFISLAGAVLLGMFAAHCGGSLPMLLGGVVFIWFFIMFEQLAGCVSRREPIALFLMHAIRSLATLLAGAAVFHFWS